MVLPQPLSLRLAVFVKATLSLRTCSSFVWTIYLAWRHWQRILISVKESELAGGALLFLTYSSQMMCCSSLKLIQKRAQQYLRSLANFATSQGKFSIFRSPLLNSAPTYLMRSNKSTNLSFAWNLKTLLVPILELPLIFKVQKFNTSPHYWRKSPHGFRVGITSSFLHRSNSSSSTPSS